MPARLVLLLMTAWLPGCAGADGAGGGHGGHR
jgi:hypothetical protein